MPVADTSVRIAWPDDADAIAEVLVATWRAEYARLLPAEALEGLSVPAIAAQWRSALIRPADARHRVLVALERARLVGFVVTAPAADPDCDPIAVGELSDLTVLAAHRGAGHGSRLLQAAADTLVSDRFTRAVSWLAADDDPRRAFLASSGWAPDGAHRELDQAGDGVVRVKQVRLHTSLVD